MEVVRNRMTNRAFAPHEVPREHFEMILEAARHAPSGANAQPWHFIVVTDPRTKEQIGEYFVREQQHRAKLHMKFPTPNYNGMKTAPGFIAIAADFRFVRAFPVLMDGSEEDRLYQQNAERILLQSVAASTMAAHLAAAALGYAVWWITAIGQEEMQRKIKPMLGVPEDLSLIDIMCFGPPAKPSYKRWKKRLDRIMSWDRFNPDNYMTIEQIDEWVRSTRHKVMYRDESKKASSQGRYARDVGPSGEVGYVDLTIREECERSKIESIANFSMRDTSHDYRCTRPRFSPNRIMGVQG